MNCGPCCSTPMEPQKDCPECGSEMEKTQVYESLGDFYTDGPYHWEWRCKCGHAEKMKP